MTNAQLRRLASFCHSRLFSTALEQNLTSASSPLKLAESPFSILKFLAEECGIPLKATSSVALKLNLNPEKGKRQVESMIEFLRSYDFSDLQIARLIDKYPNILHCRISSNLCPKFKYLASSGLGGPVLPYMVLTNPQLLRKSLDSCLKRSYAFLKTYLGSDESALVAIKRYPWILSCNLDKEFQCNIDYLSEQGMPASRIAQFIISKPGIMLQNNSRVTQWVETVKDLGVAPNNPAFIHALRVVVSYTEEALKRKVEVFKNLGWSDKDVRTTFFHYPLCFTYSADNIRAKMEFFVNQIGIKPEIIIDSPELLMFSMDKRIIPRNNAIKALLAENLVRPPSLSTWLKISEKRFLASYILKYQDKVPKLLETYLGTDLAEEYRRIELAERVNL